MRASVMVLIFLLVACGGADPQSAATPTLAPATVGTAATTTVVPATSSTTSSIPAATTTTTVAPLTGLAVTEVIRVGAAVAFATAPGDDRLFVVEKSGLVIAVSEEGEETYADLRGDVSTNGERGLLGLAFAPDFEESGRLFMHYTDRAGDSVIAEFLDDGATVQRTGTIFTVAQPASNHNGGSLLFDSRGTLYVGLGDGGGSNDRYGNGQNTNTALGAILRLRLTPDGAVPHPDNPFIDGGGEPAVWAVGIRNPWRLSVDGERMLIPDVGQNSYEEVSVVDLDERAPNLGWPLFEGLHCFRGDCDSDGLIMPLVEVPHGDGGTCSISGGVVYRGSAIPEWEGRYFYSDFCGGYLRSVTFVDNAATDHLDWTDRLTGPLGSVLAIGAGPGGELHLGLADGRVVRIDPVR